MGKANRAADYFSKGFYCSQSVIGSFCEKYDMETDVAFRISCGLNSGCRGAEICGAVSGAILVIGLKHGDSKQTCNSKTEEFIEAFKDKHGEITCRGLLGCDISTTKGKAEFKIKNLAKSTCMNMVKSAAQILEDFGY